MQEPLCISFELPVAALDALLRAARLLGRSGASPTSRSSEQGSLLGDAILTMDEDSGVIRIFLRVTRYSLIPSLMKLGNAISVSQEGNLSCTSRPLPNSR